MTTFFGLFKHQDKMAGSGTNHDDVFIVYTSSYDPIWNDKGSGASRDGGFWHPQAQGPLRPIGSVVVNNYNNINGYYSSILVGNNADSGSPPAVASPNGYTEIWNDKGSGASKDGSLWRPVAPSGYVAMGDVVQSGYSQPDTNRIWCLRQDLAQAARFGVQSTWDDKNSGASRDVSVWEVFSNLRDEAGPQVSRINSFRANPNYSAPDSRFAVLPV